MHNLLDADELEDLYYSFETESFNKYTNYKARLSAKRNKIITGLIYRTTYDPATGEVVISNGSTANFVHESTHAGQFEAQGIAFDNATGNTYAQDLGDEAEAYSAQYAFKPKSGSGLTSTSQVNSFGNITIF